MSSTPSHLQDPSTAIKLGPAHSPKFHRRQGPAALSIEQAGKTAGLFSDWLILMYEMVWFHREGSPGLPRNRRDPQGRNRPNASQRAEHFVQQ
jgi:hypothetical protein